MSLQVPLDDPEPVTRVELRVVSPNVGEKLPSYHHTTVVLPSYEEVQNLKASEDANTPRHASPSAAPQLDGMPLGDDVSFIGTFLVSLLFNWIGYLVCFCLATSIAARSGALAGFGLAFVKIAVLLK